MKSEPVTLLRDDGVAYFISTTRTFYIFKKHVAVSFNKLPAADLFVPHYHIDGFVSIVIRGKYTEELSKEEKTNYRLRKHRLGSIKYLSGETYHRVVESLPKTRTICVFFLRRIPKDPNPSANFPPPKIYSSIEELV